VARRHLSPEIVDRPKSGFRVPLKAWLRAGLRDHARDLLQSPSSLSAQYLDRAAISTLLDGHDCGRRDDSTRIFTLTSLEVWYADLKSVLQ
jgi:asparagine synthase (glutamine-hydrolysing)